MNTQKENIPLSEDWEQFEKDCDKLEQALWDEPTGAPPTAALSDKRVIYRPASKAEKDRITIYGAGNFRESSLTLGKAEAAILLAELYGFVMPEKEEKLATTLSAKEVVDMLWDAKTGTNCKKEQDKQIVFELLEAFDNLPYSVRYEQLDPVATENMKSAITKAKQHFNI